MSGRDEPIDRAALVAFLTDEFGLESREIADDAPLVSNGRIDSFQLTDLIAWVERRASITVPPRDVLLEHFDTVRMMLAYVRSRTDAT